MATDADDALAKFDLTARDVRTFHLYRHSRSKPLQRLVSILRFGPPCVVLAIAMLSAARHARLDAFVAGMMAIVSLCDAAWIALFPAFFTVLLTRQIDGPLEADSDQEFGPTEVILKAHEVQQLGARPRRVDWSAVRRVAATEAALYLYASASTAVVIPRRAFDTRDDFRAFVETARRRHEAVRSSRT